MLSVNRQRVYLSSAQSDRRSSANKTEDITFDLFRTINIQERRLFVNVVDAQIPSSSYNINGYNGFLRLVDSGDSSNVFSYTFPPKNYSTSSLVSELTSFFSGNLAITPSYDADRARLSFASTEANSFVIDAASSCDKVLGFSSNTSLVTGNTELPLVIDLSGPRAALITSPDLYTESIDSSIRPAENVLAKIALSESFGGVNYYQDSTGSKIYTPTQHISTLRFVLLDQDFGPLDLNGSNWNVTLEFEWY